LNVIQIQILKVLKTKQFRRVDISKPDKTYVKIKYICQFEIIIQRQDNDTSIHTYLGMWVTLTFKFKLLLELKIKLMFDTGIIKKGFSIDLPMVKRIKNEWNWYYFIVARKAAIRSVF